MLKVDHFRQAPKYTRLSTSDSSTTKTPFIFFRQVLPMSDGQNGCQLFTMIILEIPHGKCNHFWLILEVQIRSKVNHFRQYKNKNPFLMNRDDIYMVRIVLIKLLRSTYSLIVCATARILQKVLFRTSKKRESQRAPKMRRMPVDWSCR